jgi:hypothetical protein
MTTKKHGFLYWNNSNTYFPFLGILILLTIFGPFILNGPNKFIVQIQIQINVRVKFIFQILFFRIQIVDLIWVVEGSEP